MSTQAVTDNADAWAATVRECAELARRTGARAAVLEACRILRAHQCHEQANILLDNICTITEEA